MKLDKEDELMQVSIIVPIYNMSPYMDRCMHSILKQTYQNFKVILVDDGSTDDSLEKCIQWAKTDSRIIIISKKNEGVGIARNIGIKIASTEYITFIDADDWWDDNYLELMMQGTESGKNDIVICDIHYVIADSGKILESKVSEIRLPQGLVPKNYDIINNARTFLWGKVYRRNLFVKESKELLDYVYEDIAMTPFVLAKAKRVYHVSEPLYFYWRNRVGSIVNKGVFLYDMVPLLRVLKQRFVDAGLFEVYHQELKRLFAGQIHFVFRQIETKFKNIEKNERLEIEKKLIDLLNSTFPEMDNFYGKKVCVLENTLLINAVKNIVFNEGQIVNKDELTTNSKIDYVIGDNSFLKEVSCLIMTDTAKYIEVEVAVLNDDEKSCWNLADEIFKNI